MIKLENTEVLGWEAAIRGMRNPMNSWEKSDSAIFKGFDFNGDYYFCDINHNRKDWTNWLPLGEEPPKHELRKWIEWNNKRNLWKAEPFPKPYHDDENAAKIGDVLIGPSDHKLMLNLAKAGSVDAKYRRMIVVTVDITAPLYWWKEFDTYKIGTVANSCSTMHKIHSKEFTLEDFSYDHLCQTSIEYLKELIGVLNFYREVYNSFDEKSSDPNWLKSFVETYDLQTKKDVWYQMIQLLPSSYNQRRTVMLNYEVLAGIYPKRKDHKLDCWHAFCDWIKSLPYSEIITLEEKDGANS